MMLGFFSGHPALIDCAGSPPLQAGCEFVPGVKKTRPQFISSSVHRLKIDEAIKAQPRAGPPGYSAAFLSPSICFIDRLS
jgi:hypothetical protein